MIRAISPIDGRYANKCKELQAYFSEYALIQYRVKVEIEYLLALSDKGLKNFPALTSEVKEKLRGIYSEFTYDDALEVKNIEKKINHDVKSVEYFIGKKLKHHGLESLVSFVHFALTSQDINNTAVPLMIKNALDNVIIPVLHKLQENITSLSGRWNGIAMLSRTHGQAASPTTVGKEFRVFDERLHKQIEFIESIEIEAKFGGATGNFNAHLAAYPNLDWKTFANNFLDSMHLKRQQTTTQIEHYDQLAALFHGCIRINTILMDLCRDIWTYISMDYFSQKVIENEVGSSTMPHKVNPIDFENAEGNLGLANAIFSHLAEKLPVSRLQRDLTDSTVSRNIGVPLSHSLIAYKSLIKGLDKLVLNEEKLRSDLDQNWAIITEAIQTILRRENVKNAYEKLKSLSRGKKQLTEGDISTFVKSLDIEEKVKNELLQLTPHNYTGYH